MHLVEENKEKKYYILSGNKGFFSRYCDNGFKTKWTGLWKDTQKYLEYYSVKGLEEKNCIKTTYDYAKAKHYYKNAVETVFAPKNKSGLCIRIEFFGETQTELEFAVNIRKREENETAREYRIKTGKNNSVEVSNSLGKLGFSLIKGKMEFKENPLNKIHFPSGEKQNCFIPGKILVSGKEIIFCFVPEPEKEKKLTEAELKKELERKEEELEKFDELIECSSKELEKGFAESAKGIGLLKNNSNFFAGYPWFLQYWGRDVFWSLPALISLGKFEEAEKILLFFWKKNLDGQIPNFVEGKKVLFNSVDASLLFLIALNNYVFASGNKKILETINFRKTLGFLESKEKNGLIFHQADETWMDSINRQGAGIEVQALYLKALHSARNLTALEGKEIEVHKLEKKAVELNRKILEEYWKNGFFVDSINEKNECIKTCNPLAYLMQKKANEKEIKLFESDEFNGKKGVLTRSRKEQSFEENGYHTGLSWSLCNGWMACSEFKAERTEKAMHYLMLLIDDLDEDCVGGIGECWNSSGKLKGCGMQLWGHAFVIKAIDEFMLGIKLNAFEKKVFLQPKLSEKVNFIKRKLRMENSFFELIVERKNGKITARTTDNKIKTEFY
ncbi:MAG: amylo-alpha-1,6-glucosidase [archaeon]